MSGRVLVIVPTYNEVENLETILGRLAASVPTAHALVVDDGAPDGTGDLAEKLARLDPRVHVLGRNAKAGLGIALMQFGSINAEIGFRSHRFDAATWIDGVTIGLRATYPF